MKNFLWITVHFNLHFEKLILPMKKCNILLKNSRYDKKCVPLVGNSDHVQQWIDIDYFLIYRTQLTAWSSKQVIHYVQANFY